MRVSFYKTTKRETLDEGSTRQGTINFFRSTIKEKTKRKKMIQMKAEKRYVTHRLWHSEEEYFYYAPKNFCMEIRA
jgi:hypothetical protein